jgi:hypothetical protein
MVIRMRVTRVDINMAEANRLLNSPQGEVASLVVLTSQRVRAMCVQQTPVQDGNMKASYGFALRVRPFRHVMGRVMNFDEAALWVQTGTGIYGRRGRPITSSRPGGVLRWPNRNPGRGNVGDGAFVYRRSVRGQPANPFMLRGLIRGTSGRQRWVITPGPGVRNIGPGP